MRSFLVLFNELPIERANVKSGENSPQVVTAARCVNVGLFLSNDLRRDVEVIIGILQNDALKTITFPGDTLKRVSPDERSIAFFLLKAFDKLRDMSIGSGYIMDSGIVLKHSSVETLLSQWPYGQVFVALSDSNSTIADVRTSDGLFVFPCVEAPPASFSKFGSLKCVSTPERFILDINMHFDSLI